MRTRGFTIVETVIASAIVLVVLGAMTVAVDAFFSGQKRVSARRDALVLAASEMASFEESGALAVPGIKTRTERLLGRSYVIRTEITEEAPGVRRIDVSVSSPSAGEVDLQRKLYYPDGGV